MTRIDGTHLASLIRSLATARSDAPARVSTSQHSQAQAVTPGKPVAHDLEALRTRLRVRLRALKTEVPPASFAELAPAITLREIMVWEFGEAVLNHPDVGEVLREVGQRLQAVPETREEFARLFEHLLAP